MYLPRSRRQLRTLPYRSPKARLKPYFSRACPQDDVSSTRQTPSNYYYYKDLGNIHHHQGGMLLGNETFLVPWQYATANRLQKVRQQPAGTDTAAAANVAACAAAAAAPATAATAAAAPTGV